jgi:hypothetical protein
MFVKLAGYYSFELLTEEFGCKCGSLSFHRAVKRRVIMGTKGYCKENRRVLEGNDNVLA